MPAGAEESSWRKARSICAAPAPSATRSRPRLTLALKDGRAALTAIQFADGSITEVLSLVFAPAVTRRRDECLETLADGLDQLQAKVDGFEIEPIHVAA